MSVWEIVMADQASTFYISIQAGTEVKSGIIIEDTDDIQALGLVPGDSVFIDAGTIQEIRGADRFDRSGNLTGIGAPTLRQGGASNPYDAVVMTTEALQDSGVAEGMESMLLRVESPVITSTNSDAPAGPFGEFDISSDGTDDNAFRVDDGSSAISYDGGDPGTVYTTGERLEFVQGILSHSFGNFKLLPRDSTDVGMVTNVAVEDDAVPGSFALRQNYPNPFNPTTAIEYTVPVTSRVRLEVFDVLGRSVAVLVNGDQAVGTYTVRFDAARLASGLYLYRLTAGSKVQVKKMLFLK